MKLSYFTVWTIVKATINKGARRAKAGYFNSIGRKKPLPQA
jgi:hypothetical protein